MCIADELEVRLIELPCHLPSEGYCIGIGFDAVTLTWKVARKFDEPNLKFICNAHNIPLEQVANVKYDYSATLMRKLPADLKTELELNALEQKRASTGFKINTFANKEK